MVALAGIIGFASLIPLRRSQERAAQLAVAHAEVTALNETLEAKVAERTELAERRAQALARSNAELEQFASVAAHDLQEPLRKIRMYCERLERWQDDMPEEAHEDVVRMEAAAGRMQNLISDLLDLARVNSRGRDPVAVDLAEIAREVVGDLEAAHRRGGRDRRHRAAPGRPRRPGPAPAGSAEPDQQRPQVPPRRCAAAGPREHGDERAAGRCVVTVEDNGIGFDEKYAERIFGTFQRLHGRAEYEGTGIGLSIARKIAWRHDGDITASGVAGRRRDVPADASGRAGRGRRGSGHDELQHIPDNERTAA